MTRVTVIGIERFYPPFEPNGIECDVCGRKEIWPRETWGRERRRLHAEGWTWDGNLMDMDSTWARCPDHPKATT